MRKIILFAALLGACGPMELETAPPVVGETSILRTGKVSTIKFGYDRAVSSSKVAVFAAYDGRTILEEALRESLDKGAHVAVGGAAVEVVMVEFRLRSYSIGGFGSDHIRVEVRAGSKLFQAEVVNSGGLIRFRKLRLQRMLNELVPKIVNGL